MNRKVVLELRIFVPSSPAIYRYLQPGQVCITACEVSFRPLILRDPCGADIETEVGSLTRGDTDRMWLSLCLESRLIPKLLCFPLHCPGLTTRGPVVSQAPALFV